MYRRFLTVVSVALVSILSSGRVSAEADAPVYSPVSPAWSPVSSPIAPTPKKDCLVENGEIATKMGYKFIPNKISLGFDIKNIGSDIKVEDLLKECSNTESCVAARSDGLLLYAVQPNYETKSIWNETCMGTFERVKFTCSQKELHDRAKKGGYTFHQGYISRGRGYKRYARRVGDVKFLMEKCNKYPKCVAFRTDGWLMKKVHPKQKWDKVRLWSCNGSYIKNANPEKRPSPSQHRRKTPK